MRKIKQFSNNCATQQKSKSFYILFSYQLDNAPNEGGDVSSEMKDGNLFI